MEIEKDRQTGQTTKEGIRKKNRGGDDLCSRDGEMRVRESVHEKMRGEQMERSFSSALFP